jgi:hypothetical protein
MTGGSPKVNETMLAEALRQLIPIAETAARTIGRSWATGPVQRAVTVLKWIQQGSARAQQLDGPVPDQVAFSGVVDELARPDPGQTIPRDCIMDSPDGSCGSN